MLIYPFPDPPIDGSWTSWAANNPCTVSCGGGTELHSRSCDNPIPEYGGRLCSGDTVKTVDCGMEPCPSKD